MSAAAAAPTISAPAGCTPSCSGLCTSAGLAAAHAAHRGALLARARAQLDDPQLAEDAVQEVFVRAWAACASFDPHAGPPMRAWLATILRNVVIDMVRARSVR
ncbi:MAG: RNA polymerase subunit sigma-70, partial [Pseudonocardia sp.]|nr:RNA polymerase subunit sigma-70 [Pseudonocardia sp.]